MVTQSRGILMIINSIPIIDIFRRETRIARLDVLHYRWKAVVKGLTTSKRLVFVSKLWFFSVVSGCIFGESIDWMTFSGFKLVDKISATLARRNPFQSRGNRSSCSGHLGLRHLELRGGQEGALSRLEDLVHRPFYLALHWISRRLASIRHFPLFQVTLYYSIV